MLNNKSPEILNLIDNYFDIIRLEVEEVFKKELSKIFIGTYHG